MSNDKKPEPDFNVAADRRAYEKEHFPDDLKQRLIDIEEDYETKKAALLKKQKESYEGDVEREKNKAAKGTPLPELKPESQVNSRVEKVKRPSKTNAEQVVDQRYAKVQIKLMEEREEQIEEIYALNRDRNPSFEAEEKAMEVAREEKRHDRDVTLYQEPERQDKKPEPDRER